MVALLLVQILCTNFIQKWNLPYGNVAPGGMILVYDTDHDEQVELIFRRWIAQSFGVYFAEFVPPDSWDIVLFQHMWDTLVISHHSAEIGKIGNYLNDAF